MHPVQKGWIPAHWEVAGKSDKEGFLDLCQRKQFTSKIKSNSPISNNLGKIYLWDLASTPSNNTER